MNLTPGQLARIGTLTDQWSFLWDKRRSLWLAAEDCPDGVQIEEADLDVLLDRLPLNAASFFASKKADALLTSPSASAIACRYSRSKWTISSLVRAARISRGVDAETVCSPSKAEDEGIMPTP
jgi:hypothetical protein